MNRKSIFSFEASLGGIKPSGGIKLKMNFLVKILHFKINILTILTIIVISISLGSCSMGITNPDSYTRNHEVYAVDFNPHKLNELQIYKMNEGDWIAFESEKNGQSDRYSIEIENGFLTVISHKNKMDVPTYQNLVRLRPAGTRI